MKAEAIHRGTNFGPWRAALILRSIMSSIGPFPSRTLLGEHEKDLADKAIEYSRRALAQAEIQFAPLVRLLDGIVNRWIRESAVAHALMNNEEAGLPMTLQPAEKFYSNGHVAGVSNGG